MEEVKELELKQREELKKKIDRALYLERTIKGLNKKLNELKADIQAEGLREIENKNIRFIQFFGNQGSCEVGYKQKLQVDNYTKLAKVIGSIAQEKIKKTTEVKYDMDKKFKEALMCLYLGDYKQHDLDELLVSLGITDAKKKKQVLKKLKGEYKKDKKTLESAGIVGDLEEELDAIREQKNYEQIIRYFDIENISIEQLKLAIFVEDSLSIGLKQEEGDSDDDNEGADQ